MMSIVGLADTGKKRACDFSLGMRQRLGIAIALVNELIFDSGRIAAEISYHQLDLEEFLLVLREVRAMLDLLNINRQRVINLFKMDLLRDLLWAVRLGYRGVLFIYLTFSSFPLSISQTVSHKMSISSAE